LKEDEELECIYMQLYFKNMYYGMRNDFKRERERERERL